MSPEDVIKEAVLRAIVAVYEPWLRLPLNPEELALARYRVGRAQADLVTLRTEPAISPGRPPR
jgi:hypothetical protein